MQGIPSSASCRYLISILFYFNLNCQNKLPMGEFMHANELAHCGNDWRTRKGMGTGAGTGTGAWRAATQMKLRKKKENREMGKTKGKQWECSQWNALKIENQWTVIITCRRVRNKHIHACIYVSIWLRVCLCVCECCSSSFMALNAYGRVWKREEERVVLRFAAAKAAYPPHYTARK